MSIEVDFTALVRLDVAKRFRLCRFVNNLRGLEMFHSAAITTLLLFVFVTLLLPAVYVAYRSAMILLKRAAANSWTRDNKKWPDPAWVTRVQHAHLNCLENLPLYAALVLTAAFLGQLQIIDHAAYAFFAARVAQVVFHILSINHWVVVLRASAYFVQIGLMAYWALALLTSF